MNRSARGCSVKCFVLSHGLDTTRYKFSLLYLLLTYFSHLNHHVTSDQFKFNSIYCQKRPIQFNSFLFNSNPFYKFATAEYIYIYIYIPGNQLLSNHHWYTKLPTLKKIEEIYIYI